MKKKIFILLLLSILSIFIWNFLNQKKISSPVSAQAITPACTTKIQGDANCDGVIDDADYTIWKCEFISNGVCASPASDKTADFNLDGKVNLMDFEIWRKNKFDGTNTPTPTVDQTQPQSFQLNPVSIYFGKTMQQICNDKGQGWNCIAACEYAATDYAYFCVNCEKGWTTTDIDCYYPIPTTATYLSGCCYQNPTIPPTVMPDTCDAVNCPQGCCWGNSCWAGSHPNQCGTRGVACVVCGNGQQCVNGSCVGTIIPIATNTPTLTPTPTCASGKANCNGSWADGCETKLNTTSNCGSCGNKCTCSSNNKYPYCQSGSCKCISGGGGQQ